jgi:hypothetical protein
MARADTALLPRVQDMGNQRLTGWALKKLHGECMASLQKTLEHKTVLRMLRVHYRTLEQLQLEGRLDSVDPYARLVDRGGLTWGSDDAVILVRHLLAAVDFAFSPGKLEDDIYMQTLNGLLSDVVGIAAWRKLFVGLIEVGEHMALWKATYYRRLCCMLMNVRLGDMLRRVNAESKQHAGVLRAMLRKGDSLVTPITGHKEA